MITLAEYENHIIGRKKGLPIYLPIYIISPNKKSECPHYETIYVETEEATTVYVARCKVQNRYLTRNQVEKCINYWSECPFYNLIVSKKT